MASPAYVMHASGAMKTLLDPSPTAEAAPPRRCSENAPSSLRNVWAQAQDPPQKI